MFIDFNHVQNFNVKQLPVIESLPDGNKTAVLFCNFDQTSDSDLVSDCKVGYSKNPINVWVPDHQFLAHVKLNNKTNTLTNPAAYINSSNVQANNTLNLRNLVSDLSELRKIDIDNTVSTIDHYLKVSKNHRFLNKMFNYIDLNLSYVNTSIDLYRYFSFCVILACITNNVHSSDTKLYIALDVMPKALGFSDSDIDVLKVILNKIGFDVQAPDIVNKSNFGYKLDNRRVQTVFDVLGAYNYASLLA